MPEVLEGLAAAIPGEPEGSGGVFGFCQVKDVLGFGGRHIQGIRVKREKINTNAANPATNAKVLRSLGARTRWNSFPSLRFVPSGTATTLHQLAWWQVHLKLPRGFGWHGHTHGFTRLRRD